jgi:cellulose synthase/poly-beta-1,6-N-acetylglucosamine synthase-like glycosyltransferase
MAWIEFLYALASLVMALYGLNSLYLVWLYWRTKAVTPLDPPVLKELPRVTIQLPVYNERYLVGRLLAAVCALDYPNELLEIQVLDDSSDETTVLLAVAIREYRQKGSHIFHLRRDQRHGFKAGALAEGLRIAGGEYLAIFDADFIPQPDFLRKALPWFGDPQVGCVQGRWTHVNRDYSLLTRLQAMAIDGHFIVEQTARSHNGFFLSFNGTGGIWRKACIEDAGGWTADTLTEDLDLSYRAQLRGWRIAFLPDLAVPAEIPAQMQAYKRQQARWSKGSLQTARKLIGPLLRSSQPWQVKLEGVIHMTGYFVHLPILVALVLILPMSISHSSLLVWAPVLTLAAVGPPLLYLIAAAQDGPNFWERLRLIPLLILLGIGLSINNSQAVLAGLFSNRRGEFSRTPKFNIQHPGQRWETSDYTLKHESKVWLELASGLLAAFAMMLSIQHSSWGVLPWLIIYAGGFEYVAAVTLMQTARQNLIANRKTIR